jgi:uncharacterized protein (TIGR03382 family)
MASMLAAGVVGGLIRVAVADSCPVPDARIAHPAANASDVPLNSTIILLADSVVGEGAEPSITLTHVESGQAVSGTLERWDLLPTDVGTWLRFTPSASLEPASTYSVTLDPDCGAYFPGCEIAEVSRFGTGDSADDQPPAYVGLDSMELTLSAANQDTPPISWLRDDALERIVLHLGPMQGDEVLLLFNLRIEGDAVPYFEAVAAYETAPGVREFVGAFCESNESSAAPELLPGETYCGSVVAYDGSGNAAGGDREVCVALERCEGSNDFDGGRCPAGGCAATNHGAVGPGALALLLLALILRRRAGCGPRP